MQDRNRYAAQIHMGVPATEETDLVRLKEMREMIAGLNAADSRVVLTSPFDAAYNASGKTLTQNTPEELVIDGITLDEGDRVLIAKQLDASQNGVYVVTTLGVTGDTAAVLTRAADFNESHEFINGLVFPVLEGNANAGTRWKLRVGRCRLSLMRRRSILPKTLSIFPALWKHRSRLSGTQAQPFSHLRITGIP